MTNKILSTTKVAKINSEDFFSLIYSNSKSEKKLELTNFFTGNFCKYYNTTEELDNAFNELLNRDSLNIRDLTELGFRAE